MIGRGWRGRKTKRENLEKAQKETKESRRKGSREGLRWEWALVDQTGGPCGLWNSVALAVRVPDWRTLVVLSALSVCVCGSGPLQRKKKENAQRQNSCAHVCVEREQKSRPSDKNGEYFRRCAIEPIADRYFRPLIRYPDKWFRLPPLTKVKSHGPRVPPPWSLEDRRYRGHWGQTWANRTA